MYVRAYVSVRYDVCVCEGESGCSDLLEPTAEQLLSFYLMFVHLNNLYLQVKAAFALHQMYLNGLRVDTRRASRLRTELLSTIRDKYVALFLSENERGDYGGHANILCYKDERMFTLYATECNESVRCPPIAHYLKSWKVRKGPLSNARPSRNCFSRR